MLVWPKVMALGALLCFAIAGGGAVAFFNLLKEAQPLLDDCGHVIPTDTSDPGAEQQKAERAAKRCAQGTQRQLVAYYAGAIAIACGVLGVMMVAFAVYFRRRQRSDGTRWSRSRRAQF